MEKTNKEKNMKVNMIAADSELLEKEFKTIRKLPITNIFQVVVIPHSLKLTNLIKLQEKDLVNIEFDILLKYIKNN